MKFGWILLAFLPASSFAQLQFSPTSSTQWTQSGGWYQASISICDKLNSQFRVTNTGTQSVTLIGATPIAISGTGFSIPTPAEPTSPYTLAPGAFWVFYVDFTPSGAGSYSATLQAGGSSATLYVTVTGGSGCLSQSGSPISAGSTLNFGQVAIGATATQSFTLVNSTQTASTIPQIAVTGAGFQATGLPAANSSLPPGQSVSFQIVFTPAAAQSYQGTLTVGQSIFTLTGLGLSPPPPTASIQLSQTSVTSGQQASVSIALASASQVSGTGTLTMSFQPNASLTGVTDDPAIGFLSGAKRSATITISPGDTLGEFGPSKTSLSFQTGTTAGTITFTLTMSGGGKQTATLTIAPAVVTFDPQTGITVTRLVNQINVAVTGYDNTYSASQLSITFYNQTGQSYPFPLSVASQFASYFQKTQTGGAFALLAQFPVTQGDSSTITSADVSLTNSAGTSQVRHISF